MFIQRIINIIKREYAVLYARFLLKNKISFTDYVIYCLLKFRIIQQKIISSLIYKIDENDLFYFFYLYGLKHPLALSKKFQKDSIGVSILELLGPLNWHKYEKMGTYINISDNVIDCGAAEGLFSLMAQPRSNHVFIIEPVPSFVKGLKSTFSKCENITILDIGLSDKEDVLYLQENGTGSKLKEAECGIPIQVHTIDSLFYDKNIPVNFIKIDVEGLEMNVLEGAIKTIKANKPKLAIASYHFTGDSKKFINFFNSLNLGYKYESAGVFYTYEPVLLHFFV